MTDLASLDATAQAELVRGGEATPRELVKAAVERVEALNPQLNAVIHTEFDAARTAADGELADGPFRGVPFLIKDIGANQAGLPYWMSNRGLKNAGHRSGADTELGARFRRAGLVTLGKTNLPEFGSCPTTQPLTEGPTNNPWDPTRSPSGSSGGSAAAVASGMVPIAHANDGGGSTRLPAAWNGLVGLKTTRGLVPNPGNVSRLTSELVVTTTVRDTAAFLASVQGAVDGDLFSTPPQHTPPTAPLRVAVMRDGGRIEVDPDCIAGVDATAATLEAMGHHVEIVDSDHLLGPASRVNGELWMAGIARRVEAAGELIGRELTSDDVEPYNWTAAQRGKDMRATEWISAGERQHAWSNGVIDWMSSYDVLVTPTAGVPPMKTDELWPPEVKPWKISATYARIGLFTLPFNVTGQPAISLPLHETGTGLPVGVQLVANMGHDPLLLQLAAELENAMPWRGRRPQVHASNQA
ncbi:MAG: amidase [Actinomycetota bacterium]